MGRTPETDKRFAVRAAKLRKTQKKVKPSGFFSDVSIDRLEITKRKRQ
jgi:hypothetical protein